MGWFFWVRHVVRLKKPSIFEEGQRSLYQEDISQNLQENPRHSLFQYVSPAENSHTSHEKIWNRAIDSSPQKTKRPSCISLIKPSTSLFTKFSSATTRVFNPKQEKLEAGGHTWASCSPTFSASRHRNLSTFYRHLCLKSSSFWSGYQFGNHVSCRDSLQESLKDPHEAISGGYF